MLAQKCTAMPDSPEQHARRQIDAILTASGGLSKRGNLCVSLGVAIAELTFKTGEPDYTLFVDSRAIGNSCRSASDRFSKSTRSIGMTFEGRKERSEVVARANLSELGDKTRMSTN
jgi:hypothetical protein